MRDTCKSEICKHILQVQSETQEIPVIPVGIKIAMQHAAENAMDLGEKQSVLLIKLCPIYRILIVFIANSKIRMHLTGLTVRHRNFL